MPTPRGETSLLLQQVRDATSVLPFVISFSAPCQGDLNRKLASSRMVITITLNITAAQM